MPLPAALAFLVTLLALVGAVVWALVVRLRQERAGQAPASRSSLPVLIGAALAVVGGVWLVSSLAGWGWGRVAVFRLALAGLVFVAVAHGSRRL